MSSDGAIKKYWDADPPMAFTDLEYDYNRKREFRYNLQDYMLETFEFNKFSGKSVLDLGCGAGIDSAEFARNGANVVSVDFSSSAVELTKKLLAEAGLDAHVIQASALYLPFRSAIFDCVYCFGVLHHIPQVDKALVEIHNVLRKDGIVMAMLYNRDSLLFAYSILYLKGFKKGLLKTNNIEELISSSTERRAGNPYTRVYTKSEAIALFSRYFDEVKAEIKYNVIDTENMRKVKLPIPDSLELGWHIIIKATKPRSKST